MNAPLQSVAESVAASAREWGVGGIDRAIGHSLALAATKISHSLALAATKAGDSLVLAATKAGHSLALAATKAGDSLVLAATGICRRGDGRFEPAGRAR